MDCCRNIVRVIITPSAWLKQRVNKRGDCRALRQDKECAQQQYDNNNGAHQNFLRVFMKPQRSIINSVISRVSQRDAVREVLIRYGKFSSHCPVFGALDHLRIGVS